MNRLFTLASALILTWTLNAQNGLDFDGVDDFIQTSAPAISGTNARTVEAWINTSSNYSPSNGGTQGVILDMGTMSNGQRFTINVLWSNSLRVEIGGHGISGTTAINDGNWHHVAVVYDPAQSTKVFLYIDGQLETSGNFSSSVFMNTSAGNIVIGRRMDNVNYFDGIIDEVRVWNTARTASEIANASNNEFCSVPTGLVAYYKLNEGIAASTNTGITTAADLVMGNDGTLNNFALSGTTSNWVTGYALATGNVQDSLSATECFSYTSPSGETYTSSGIYTDTIPTAFGCDSILTIDLTINSIDTTLQVNNQTITAVHNGTNYQWLDCENNYAPIAGQTGQSITVSNNGSYAVQIVSNGCLDTTECATIGGIGLQESKAQTLHLFPNPTRDQFRVKGWEGAFSYAVHDLSGRTVLRGTANSDSLIDVKDLSPGTYYIHIQNDEDVGFMKFIVR